MSADPKPSECPTCGIQAQGVAELYKEVARLRKALEEIIARGSSYTCVQIAREALEGKGEGK